jgi:3-dehydroquinate synthase
MILTVKTVSGAYPIHIERGILKKAGEYIDLASRRICIVCDSGVPSHYVDAVAAQCQSATIFRFPMGEQSKNEQTLRLLWNELLAHQFDRKDAIVAIGGGVVTDLAGFAAATYMRGIDFYNIPTTLLSQVDASVGGKTAIDFNGYKNIIGAFWQPRAVLIDPETLSTLPMRRIADGLAEIVKMALTCDKELFSLIEEARWLPSSEGCVPKSMDEIIARALDIKIRVVQEDEREAGLRRVLNFGHTIGHAIESSQNPTVLYHGECVALGMLVMCSPNVRDRLIPVLKKCGLPHEIARIPSPDVLKQALLHDKKAAGDRINTVYVEEIGTFAMCSHTADALCELIVQVKSFVEKEHSI